MFYNQKGSAAIMGVVVALFLSIIAAAATTSVTTSLKTSKINSDMISAQYAAEAGAIRAIDMFNQSTQEWTWVNQSQGDENWQTVSNNANTKYHVTIKSGNTQVVPNTPADPGTYTVISKGSVNGVTKTVTVPVTVAAASGGIVSKYAVYSGGNLDIYGGSSPAPYLNLDIGTNGSNVKIDMGSNKLLGMLYTSHSPSYVYYPNAPKDSNGKQTWYQQVTSEQVGTLNVTIPTVPEMSSNVSSYPTLPTNVSYGCYNGNYDLSNDNYYFNGNYQLNNSKLKATSKSKVTLYIKGNLYLTGTSIIEGDNADIDIYTSGNVKLDNYGAIKVSNSTKTSKLNIYAQGTVYLTNNTRIDGDNVVIMSKSTNNEAIKIDNSGAINKDSATAVTKIYSQGSVYFTTSNTTPVIGGAAAMVVTNKQVKLDNSVQAPNTIFIANGASTQSYIGGTINIAGIYVNGTLKIDGSPGVNRNNQKTTVMQLLGTSLQQAVGGSSGSGSGSSTVSVGAWSRL